MLRFTWVLTLVLSWQGLPALSGSSASEAHSRADALLSEADEMVLRGGPGDAKALLHHCQKIATQAEAILADLPREHPRARSAAEHLHEAIHHCRRVEKVGDQQDYGLMLSPAVKARAAVREAVKQLATFRTGS